MIRLAVRNIRRNRKRSLLSMIAIFIGSLIVVISEAWIGGVVNAYINGSARLQTGHIRVMHKNYRKRERFLPVDELIPDIEQLKKRLRTIPGIIRVEERLRFGILLGKGSRSFPAVGVGLEFGNSRLGIKNHLLKKSKAVPFRENGLYPGKKLAKKLRAKTGDSLLLATRTSWGGLNGIKAVVARPVSTGSSKLDRAGFFISIRNARKLLKTGKSGTEIYIYLDNYKNAKQIAGRIQKILPPDTVALTLAQQNPAFYEYLTTVQSFMVLIDSFILFLASFVIINTMMMAVFERTREIGMLKALGMPESGIIRVFGLEGAIMGVAGSCLGALTGWILAIITAGVGIDLTSQMEGIDMPLEYIIRPQTGAETVLITILLAALISGTAAIIPALKIRKQSAAEALRSV